MGARCSLSAGRYMDRGRGMGKRCLEEDCLVCVVGSRNTCRRGCDVVNTDVPSEEYRIDGLGSHCARLPCSFIAADWGPTACIESGTSLV